MLGKIASKKGRGGICTGLDLCTGVQDTFWRLLAQSYLPLCDPIVLYEVLHVKVNSVTGLTGMRPVGICGSAKPLVSIL